MTKGQIIQRLLHALTHVLCFYDSEWSLFVFHLWTEVSLWWGGTMLWSTELQKSLSLWNPVPRHDARR